MMNNTDSMINTLKPHVSAEDMLERSYWYGPNLATMLASSHETAGAFSLVKTMLRKGFDPPLHLHEREDENNYILSGEILYSIGEKQFHAKPGDYIHLPRGVQHRFELLTDMAETLLLITPGGFEQMFMACGRPAKA